MKKVSIVTPFYNEEKSIKDYFLAINEVFKSIPEVSYEIVAVDDGSVDKTYEILKKHAKSQNNIRVIKLSRNFGKEAALTAGLDYALGDAAIPLDADLQDSPEIIPNMISEWNKGYKVVLAERSNRQDPILKKITAFLFYKIASKIMDSKVPKNIGDFRLIDRMVLNEIKNLREKNRFMRGLLSWPGYSTSKVYYVRNGRKNGETKYNYKSMMKYAFDGIFSFSTFPIRLMLYLGAFVSISSFIYAIYIIYQKMVNDVGVPGYASLMTIMLFLNGVILISIGVLGEYIGRIFNEVKARPIYLVEDIVN